MEEPLDGVCRQALVPPAHVPKQPDAIHHCAASHGQHKTEPELINPA